MAGGTAMIEATNSGGVVNISLLVDGRREL